jgi:hypothetical protein
MDNKNLTTSPDKTPERWLPIPGFPGYDVSDQGRVRSYRRKIGRTGGGYEWILDNYPQTICNPRPDKDGYLYITLRAGNNKSTRRIHRLVLETFVGQRPPGLQCRHRDGIRAHNFLINLTWGTPKENSADTKLHGNTPNQRGMNGPAAKLTDDQVLKIRELYAHGHFQKDIGKMFGICQPTVHKIVHRQRWTHI